jgi:hypothetical protein
MADTGEIEPSLFELVTDYSDWLASGDNSVSEPLEKDNDLVIFAENFLLQFSRAHLRQKVTGLNERSEKQLVAERRRLQGEANTDKAQLLIFHLEELCSKVGEISYSNSEVDAEEFRLQYFPDLLARIIAWLEEITAAQNIKTAAIKALSQYNLAIGQD